MCGLLALSTKGVAPTHGPMTGCKMLAAEHEAGHLQSRWIRIDQVLCLRISNVNVLGQFTRGSPPTSGTVA